MAISAIQKTEPKNMSIPLTAAAGGAAGLALRHIIPVCKEEIDYVYFNQVNDLKQNNLLSAKKNFIEIAKKQLSKEKNNEALKLFIKRASAKSVFHAKEAKEKIKNAPQNVQAQVKTYLDAFFKKMKAAKILANGNMEQLVKQQRPYLAFILPGLALGAAAAFVHNVVGKISEN